MSCAFAQSAADSITPLDEVVVLGRATDLLGTAASASQGSVGYHELGTRPFLRRGELLEVIPGLVITQHSGGGKANQYFLRGFNLDHGTDFSVSVEGMPVNLRTHAHGQGYADLNFLIPEVVREVSYSKGPFFAEVGDFSAAGAAEFTFFNELPSNFISTTGGENGFMRLVAGGSMHQEHAASTAVVEITSDDGPWSLPEHYHRINGIVRRHWESDGREFALTALAYRGRWRSTDQIPLRAVESGRLDRFDAIDPSDEGDSQRASLSFESSAKTEGGESHFDVYAIQYRLSLYSNFTYFLEDPVNGDQFNQQDRRVLLGGQANHTWSSQILGRNSETRIGLQAREDFIGRVSLRKTSQRALLSTVRDDDVQEGSIGAWAQNETRWNSWLRSTVGARLDWYDFNVNSDLSVNSGRREAGLASPKLSLAFGPWSKSEVYLNAGFGFHSNDARGTTIRVDPRSGSAAEPVSPLVRSRGIESGVRTSFVPGLVSSLSVWVLDLDSELVFTGDSGGTEAAGATRRYGLEWANFYRASSWLTLDCDVSFTHARYREEVEGGGDRIPNSISSVVTAGATLDLPKGFYGSLRLRYFGPQALVEDDTARAPSTLTFNGRLGYRWNKWDVNLEALNLLNRKNNDISYFYTSRLIGEPSEGIDDVHFHPAEPRTLRLTLVRRF